MFPDFSEIEQLGKNLVAFMSEVKVKLNLLESAQEKLDVKLDFIINKLKEEKS